MWELELADPLIPSNRRATSLSLGLADAPIDNFYVVNLAFY
jgi:hypothetical protein